MKVRVAYTTEVSDDFRRALSHAFGECGQMATRQEVKRNLELVGRNTDEDLLEEWQDCEQCNP